jgi:hypothetical protein
MPERAERILNYGWQENRSNDNSFVGLNNKVKCYKLSYAWKEFQGLIQ